VRRSPCSPARGSAHSQTSTHHRRRQSAAFPIWLRLERCGLSVSAAVRPCSISREKCWVDCAACWTGAKRYEHLTGVSFGGLQGRMPARALRSSPADGRSPAMTRRRCDEDPGSGPAWLIPPGNAGKVAHGDGTAEVTAREEAIVLQQGPPEYRQQRQGTTPEIAQLTARRAALQIVRRQLPGELRPACIAIPATLIPSHLAHIRSGFPPRTAFT